MIIFCQSFVSLYYEDGPSHDHGPSLIRQSAVLFANKVKNTPFKARNCQPIGPHVISISETSTKWGDSVTVWYKSMEKVEV